MEKRFYIKTFGCQMNVADSERMAALLGETGLKRAEAPEEADVILLNGCTVREKAVHKALSSLGEFRMLRRRPGSRGPLIGVGGCVGQLEKESLFARAPELDFVFGTDAIDQLPEILHRVSGGERHVVYADFDRRSDYSTETKVLGEKAQAFVNIMKGCDKYCTYCIVPFTRGREKSRRISEVVDDVSRLVARGVREVTLLGQNVNSFGKGSSNEAGREPRELTNPIGKVGPRAGEENFPQLVRALDADPRCASLRRIRFTSSHPLDFSDELIACYAAPERGGVRRLAPHLHLPVQSGSNEVLQRMGRHHRIETYQGQMDRLREVSPDVGLSTDLIVGFPGETEADFEATLRLLDRVRYDSIYAFAYSPRPGTRAAKLADDVPDGVKNARLNRLLAHQLGIAERRYASRIGRVMEVGVEGEAKNQKSAVGPGGSRANDGRVWAGRTGCNRVIHFTDGSPRNFTGRFVDVRVTAATSLSLRGELLLDAGAAEPEGSRASEGRSA